jgi:hypothetical protein
VQYILNAKLSGAHLGDPLLGLNSPVTLSVGGAAAVGSTTMVYVPATPSPVGEPTTIVIQPNDAQVKFNPYPTLTLNLTEGLKQNPNWTLPRIVRFEKPYRVPNTHSP